MSNEPPLIYVYLGNSLPHYAKHSLTIASENYSGRIIVIVDRPSSFSIPGVDFVLTDGWYSGNDFKKFRAHSPLDPYFRGGFWFHAAERFFVINEFMRFYDEFRFFHAELDVMILGLDGLAEVLDNQGYAFFAPVQRADRAIASTVYVNSQESFLRFLDFLSLHSNSGNEMKILGTFFSQFPEFTRALPCEGQIGDAPYSPPNLLDPSATGYLDGLGLGPWLFGYDPRNLRGGSWNHYQEGGKPFRFQAMSFSLSKNPRRLLVKRGRKQVASFRTVHIHAKNFSQLRYRNVLRIFVWVAGLPFAVPLRLGLGNLYASFTRLVFSRQFSRVFEQLPSQLIRIAHPLLRLVVLKSALVLSDRQRNLFARSFPSGQRLIGAVESALRRADLVPVMLSKSVLNAVSNSETGVQITPEIIRELAIIEHRLSEVGTGLYIIRGQDVVYLPLGARIGRNILVSREKSFPQTRHAWGFWSDLNNRGALSYTGQVQVIGHETVRKMFPSGISDAIKWVEFSAAGDAHPSLFQSYGHWFVRLNPGSTTFLDGESVGARLQKLVKTVSVE